MMHQANNNGPYSFFSALDMQVQRTPDAPVLLSPTRTALSYRQLYNHVLTTVAQLNQLGIGRGKRAAVAVPDGPEMAAIMTSVLCTATIVLLNVASKAEDFAHILTKARVDVLIVQIDLVSPVIEVAVAQGIPIIYLTPQLDQPAGLFTLQGPEGLTPVAPDWAAPEDVAFIIATSGTTERARLVPRTSKSLFISVIDLIPLGGLTAQDRLMLLIPMHFIAGVTDLAWVLCVGACLVCIPKFDAVNFYRWLDELHPTSAMASPHHWRAILAHAPFNKDVLSRVQLKYLHAWAMVLTAELVQELETVFKAAIVNGYGSTETSGVAVSQAHGALKPGEVGVSLAHTEIEIRDPNGHALPTGEVGEIVVRGPTVFTGYLGDPEATNSVLIDGWFHIGDMGHLDQEGHLFITGRLKEQINRGGAKVAPHEVEEALLAHPAVAEAVAFGIPERSLGEEIGVAVVIHAQQTVTEKELRTFAAQRLEEYKAPRVVVIVDNLPRTMLGKLQRIGLAERLGISLPNPTPTERNSAVSSTATEQALVGIWSDILNHPAESISRQATFRDSGGDSLAATRLVFTIRERLGVQVTILDLFDAPTIADQARVIDKLIAEPQSSHSQGKYLIPIQPNGSYPPLYCVHALEGGVNFYQDLVPYLNPEQPVYGLLARGMDDGQEPYSTVDEMAAQHFQQITAVQQQGPYYLCGYSFGGRVALETARLLYNAGHADTYVLIIDDMLQLNAVYRQIISKPKSLLNRLDSLRFALTELEPLHRRLYLQQRIGHYWKKLLPQQHRKIDLTADRVLPLTSQRVSEAALEAGRVYIPHPYNGHVRYLFGLGNEINLPLFRILKEIGTGDFTIRSVPGGHWSLFAAPNIDTVGREVQCWLAEQRGLKTG